MLDTIGIKKLTRKIGDTLIEIDDVARTLEHGAVARLQAERSVRKNEERLRLAVEAGNVGIWQRNLRSGK